MKTYPFFILLASICIFFSCSNEEIPSKNEGNEIESTYIFTNEHINIPLNIIDTLDLGNGKLKFTTNISPDSMSGIGFGERKFMINDTYYFDLYYTNSLNSAVINTPVLFYNIYDSVLFIQDGYPRLESLGDDAQKIKEIRQDNWEALGESWNHFVSMLKENNVVVIEAEENPNTEEKYPNSGDSIVIHKENIKSIDKETGKIELHEKISFENISQLKWEMYKLCVDSVAYFDVFFTTSYNSMIINIPVLYYDIKEGDLYLQDGYPMVEVLGDKKEQAQKIRNENWKAIEEQWLNLLEYIE